MNLRLILLAPPAGVDYGLQSGQGSGYETVQTQRSAGKDLRFEFSVEVKPCGHFAESWKFLKLQFESMPIEDGSVSSLRAGSLPSMT